MDPKPPTAPGLASGPPKAEPEGIDFAKWGSVSRMPVTLARQVIARRMWESWNAIPHVTQFGDADFTRLDEMRRRHAPAYEAAGARLTLTPLVLKAVAQTLRKHPIVNSSLDEAANEIVVKDYVHVGVAVDTKRGLMVPVVRDVDRRSVLEVARDLQHLAQKAHDRKLTIGEMTGGSFTVSNQGAVGGSHFTPIINRPEVAILGLGRGEMKPVARDGAVALGLVTPLSLSYDHRVIDGATAARFMLDLVAALQEFGEEAVRM